MIKLCKHVVFPQAAQQKQSKPLVHPLVDEAKNKEVVSTTPPRSPRSARSSRIQSPSTSTKQDVSIANNTKYEEMYENGKGEFLVFSL